MSVKLGGCSRILLVSMGLIALGVLSQVGAVSGHAPGQQSQEKVSRQEETPRQAKSPLFLAPALSQAAKGSKNWRLAQQLRSVYSEFMRPEPSGDERVRRKRIRELLPIVERILAEIEDPLSYRATFIYFLWPVTLLGREWSPEQLAHCNKIHYEEWYRPRVMKDLRLRREGRIDWGLLARGLQVIAQEHTNIGPIGDGALEPRHLADLKRVERFWEEHPPAGRPGRMWFALHQFRGGAFRERRVRFPEEDSRDLEWLRGLAGKVAQMPPWGRSVGLESWSGYYAWVTHIWRPQAGSREDLLGEIYLSLAWTERGRGRLFAAMRDFAAAEHYLTLSDNQHRLANLHDTRAWLLAALGLTDEALASVDRAETYYDEWEPHRGPMRCAWGRGDAYRYAGQYRRAAECYAHAKSFTECGDTWERERLARSLDICRLRAALDEGEPKAALRLMAEIRANPGIGRELSAEHLVLEAMAHIEAGQHKTAHALLAELPEELGPRTGFEAAVLQARIAAQAGDAQGVIAALERATVQWQQFLRTRLLALPPVGAARLIGLFEAQVQQVLRILFDMEGRWGGARSRSSGHAAAYRLASAVRGLGIHELLGARSARILASLSGVEKAEFERLKLALGRERLGWHEQPLAKGTARRMANRLLRKKRGSAALAARRMTELLHIACVRAGRPGALASVVPQMAQLRATLHADELLLDYMFDGPGPGARASAFVLGAQEFRWVDLDVTRAEIAELSRVQAFATLLNPLLVSSGVKSILLAREGAILEQPFALLQDEDGRRLIERCALTAVQGSIAVYRDRTERRRHAWPVDLVGLAHPDYGGEGAELVAQRRERLLRDGPPDALPASANELSAALTALEPDLSLPKTATELREQATVRGARVRGFFGAEASERRLMTDPEFAEARIVHLACHARGSKIAAKNYLILSLSAEDPLYDGIVDRLELLQRSMSCQLLVISACEGASSGSDRVRDSGGLARAGLAAGAEHVLASKRRIEDAGAARFMTLFYRELRRDGGWQAPAHSLRRAQLAAAAAGIEERLWASFVLWGAGGR